MISKNLIDPLDYPVNRDTKKEESGLKDKVSFCPQCQKSMITATCQGYLVDVCLDHNIVIPKV